MTEYPQYLLTPHWQKVRAEAIARAKGRCQLCNIKASLEVHHRTYVRKGKELPEDVVALCDPCHEGFHKMSHVQKHGISPAFRKLLQRQGVI